jgi:hypothetical protein
MPYLLPNPFPDQGLHVPDYDKDASSWMTPANIQEPPKPGSPEAAAAMVEIPCSFYTEDMTPMAYYPYSSSTQGYVSVSVIEKMWWDRFEWLWDNESWLDEGESVGYGSIFPLIWHPETAGRSHIIGMLDSFIGKMVAMQREYGSAQIEFQTIGAAARDYKASSTS